MGAKKEEIKEIKQPEVKCKRCGQCCSQMVLSVSPQELKERYDEWKDWHDKKRTDHGTGKELHRISGDIWTIYPMLVYVKEFKKFKASKHGGATGKTKKGYIYRCKHLSMKNRIANCTIHDIKPWMCKSYGNQIARKDYKNTYYPKCVWLN